MMMLTGCSGKKVGISSKREKCLLLHDMSYPHKAIEFDYALKGIDLKDYIIKDMDNPKQIVIMDSLIKQHTYLNRIIPLHRRQILNANLVYEKTCKE